MVRPFHAIKNSNTMQFRRIFLGTQKSGTIPDDSVPADFFHRGNLQF